MAGVRPIRAQIRQWLRDRIAADGFSATARSLGLADATLARAVGALDVQHGTEAVLEVAFSRRAAA